MGCDTCSKERRTRCNIEIILIFLIVMGLIYGAIRYS
jgi:hypothetical protein